MDQPLTFTEWTKYVFDRPVIDPEWYWGDFDYWDGSSDITLRLLTETFERSGEILPAYTDAQVSQGLNFMINPACSNYVCSVLEPSIPCTTRLRCIRSMYTLFEQCFAKRCSPYLSHLNESNSSPLNGLCYMWWGEIFPVHPQPNNPANVEIEAEFIEVMTRTLYLASDACRESALHGLGHWRMYYPWIGKRITKFLLRHPWMRKELRRYALAARDHIIQ